MNRTMLLLAAIALVAAAAWAFRAPSVPAAGEKKGCCHSAPDRAAMLTSK